MLRTKLFLFCSVFISLFLFNGGIKAQQIYHHQFNPIKGFVDQLERPYRDELSLNGKWLFMPVFENDIKKFIKPDNFKWDPVSIKIPSPWNVNSFARGDGGDFLTFPSYPESWEKAQMGWMKKEFVLPAGWDGKRLKLHFEAIAGFARIYVNGKLAGENLDIFFPTELDVTGLVRKGKNEILVGVAKASLTDVQGKYGRRNYVAGSFWGQHIAGIWQDVSLIAIPELSISNVFVQPDVQNDRLSFVVSIKNNSSKIQSVNLHASIRRWAKPTSGDINLAPEDNGVLKEEALQMEGPSKTLLQPGDSIVVNLSQKVDGKLKNWTPETPNLYGAVISLNTNKKQIVDTKYTRFGWRQFTTKGTVLLLNGKPIVLKGDSWHFMGIPQMTRRYAWGWFKMLKDANANAVRLHAQPYPSFYLDVADEMGICVLDETGIWSSDGGPKMDSDDYWVFCKKHVGSLVKRDRNHPSVFGWSVCNETLPVVINVFHAPESIVQRQIAEINNWVKIVRSLDNTRDWISGDGEDMRPTDLPIVIGHYGDEGSMKKWSSQGKPWGVGETGMGYYGTPKQISVFNGNRAYESQQGRMEGLAIEAYDLIGKQQKHNAVYTSVFNIIWYGLKPLELGLKDTTRASKPEDGIFFSDYKEGMPGVQPERIGPYTSTINPGYDSSLPLYKPWPLFYAIQAINATPSKTFKIESIARTTPVAEKPKDANINEVGFVSTNNSPLKVYLTEMGVPLVEAVQGHDYMLIIIDGSLLPEVQTSKQILDDCLKSGGTVLVWGVSPESIAKLNLLLPFPLELTDRKATSFVKLQPDLMTEGLDNKNLYFTELFKQPIMKYGLKGEIVQKGEVLLSACNTDWSRWNSRPEYLKTAAVYRSERESKPEGATLIKLQKGPGQLYLSSIDLMSLKVYGEDLFKTFMKNLGVQIKTIVIKNRKAVTRDAVLDQALILNCSFNPAHDPEKMTNQQFISVYESGNDKSVAGLRKLIQSNAQGFLELDKVRFEMGQAKPEVYLSFWLYSPRSLVNLLVEPDIPKLNILIEGLDRSSIFINGVSVTIDGSSLNQKQLEILPLEKGWNHILIKVTRESENMSWSAKIRFESNNADFLRQLNSSVVQ